MTWLSNTLTWYFMLVIIGAVFYPLTRRIFPIFYDRGYAFSKALGIILITYTMYVLGTLHILPFSYVSLGVIIFAYLTLNLYLLQTGHRHNNNHAPLPMIIFEEALFAVAFFAWAAIRSKEPSIQSLEKFMDFGFMQSALRGEYFPTKDMWLAGKSINYYYFGHLSGAVLTRLSTIPAHIAYNLILAQIFALAITQTFSLTFTLVYRASKKHIKRAFVAGILGTFLVNLGGNLHTLYSFTKGYGSDPKPLWELAPKFGLGDLLNPLKVLTELPQNYWYPDATRFVPFTIHEFPLYSYVVADLHGHVYGIPFVLLSLGILYTLFAQKNTLAQAPFWENLKDHLSFHRGYLGYVILMSFMVSIHLMTNAFDAPIYLLLSSIVLLGIFGFSLQTVLYGSILAGGFFLFTLPFSVGFEPFATGIGFNCVYADLASTLQRAVAGTFLEKRFLFEGNCQSSHWWMLLTLWGFFWVNFAFLVTHILRKHMRVGQTTFFVLILFGYSTMLVILPEFVYAKDIYPTHFRANTMFKLGYQAFIMMGLASAYTFALFKESIKSSLAKVYMVVFSILFFIVALYPSMAVNSYYSPTSKTFTLDGSQWMLTTYPEYHEIIQYLNAQVKGQPTILEAQGDSYTNYNVVSAYTGLPTVAGWWVHEWLWRGDSQVVGSLIPEIESLFTSEDTDYTLSLLKKHRIEYIIIGSNEREKYPALVEDKFEALGQAVFRSANGSGVIYQIPIDRY